MIAHEHHWPFGSVPFGGLLRRKIAPSPLIFNVFSALAVTRRLGLGCTKSNMQWVPPGRSLLSGEVEVDESYPGGLGKGVSGRETYKKTLVIIAAQVDGKKIGRIRVQRVRNARAESLRNFIEATIIPGSVAHTDDWPGYRWLASVDFEHKVNVIKKSRSSASELLPRARAGWHPC